MHRAGGPLLFACLWLASASSEATAQSACPAPQTVCAARETVFAIAAFDPAGSAVRIGPDLLVTNRHVTVDRREAELFLPDGSTVLARVVPSAYPGDLVLLHSDALDPGPVLTPVGEAPDGVLYSVAAAPGNREIRVYAPGNERLPPAEGKPLARLHHDAENEPGNSGGALLDGAGALVGIITSGGDGRNEAIPAGEIRRLIELSGAAHREKDAALGTAYRLCLERLTVRGSRTGPMADPEARRLIDACGDSGNRQLFDQAAQSLGRAGRFGQSARLFRRGLEQDPNALNTRLGLLVTLQRDRRFADQLPHLNWLIEVLPEDAQVLRMALMAGKWAGDAALARRALALTELHHPETAPAARRFFESDAPAPRAR